ncbi:MAG: hypothetical protein MR787_01280 [Bacteroidales bacterium]|nr:hypothetical protein [Bacteroidales bacterium]
MSPLRRRTLLPFRRENAPGMKWTEAMDSTDVQMAHAVAAMGTSGYCGLPRLV